jgi:integrase
MAGFVFRKAQSISDRTLKSLVKEKAPAGKRIEITDANHPGFVVHLNDRGKITFLAVGRFGESKHPSRRTVGIYGGNTDRGARIFTLADARAEAEGWRNQARAGKDPKLEIVRAKRLRQRQAASTVEKAVDEFIKVKLARERKGDEVGRDIKKEFVSRWGSRPLCDIERADLVEAIEEVRDRGAPYQAYNLLGYARRFFDWASFKYDLEKTPCDRLRPKHLGLKKIPRKRILDPVELAALWEASEGLGYPYGPLFQLLAVTGQRLSDIAECSWSEIDLKKKLLTIPAARFKSDSDHVVPLSDLAMKILESLPRFKRGDYVFSSTFGATPINGLSKPKTRLDDAMLKVLRKGDDKAKLEPFVIHDIRRTMRSGLSALPIENHVRELVIGHTQPGLHKVYDQHRYLDEKRHALDLWAARLQCITNPATDNVVNIRSA